MITRLGRLLEKAERLLDVRLQIAEHDLKMRKTWPFPVDLYGPRGTEIRFPEPPLQVEPIWIPPDMS